MPAVDYTTTPPAAMNFILEAFESNVVLDLCGNIYSQLVSALDVSAVAILEVDLNDIKNTFKFETDATDVSNVATSDIKYYVDSASWPSVADLNPANAMLDRTSEGAARAIATADGNVSYAANKMMVCHDFTRYLAQQLFNTHLGVDLFNNETELLQSIRRATDDSAAGHTYYDILDVLKNVDTTGSGSSPNAGLVSDPSGSYMTNSTAGNPVANKLNVCRVLFNQMIDASGVHRFADILSGITTNPDGSTHAIQSLPFIEGDSISFKLIINPASGQHNLTQVSPFGARSYEIRLVLKSIPNNTAVDAGEL